MDLTDWKPASDLPPQLEGQHTSGLVLVLLGGANYEPAVACYNYSTGKWQGDYFGDYGNSLSRLVAYWKLVGPLPPPLPESFITALEPDFVSEETPMRALFAGVDAADKPLHKTLLEAVRHNGMQGVWIRSSGTKQKTFYYVDFIVRDPLELRDIKQQLGRLDVPFTISAKLKKPL